MFALTEAPVDAAALLAAVDDPACGAQILFLGVVRDHNEGRRVHFLEYEAYPAMAIASFERIAAEVRARCGSEVRVAMVHRTGRLEIGAVSVGIACAAPHREAAYRASRLAIEALKRESPIWKKEHFEGGEVWVEGPREPAPPVD